MAARNQDGQGPASRQTLGQRLAQGLQPIRRDEAPIYRGNQRRPLVSFESPAYGRFSSHAIRDIGDCAKSRMLETRHPQALRAWRSGVPGYLLMEPVELHDETAPDQYKLIWSRGYRECNVDLLPIFQPRNLQVPRGYVSEMPVSIEDVPDNGAFLVIHTGEATVRAIRDAERTPSDQTAAAEQDD